jgi:transposase
MDYKLFVGIDQSKLTFDAAVLHPDKPDEVHHEKFDNNPKGLKKMIRWIQSLHKVALHDILFCAEHTGLYCLPLSIFLSEQHAHLWLENALHIKLSSGLKRGKSDPADAKDIAHYCYTHRAQVKLYQLPGKTILALKLLLTCRTRLVKQQSAWKINCKELTEFDADAIGLITKESKSLIKTFDKKIETIDAQMLKLIEEDEQLQKQFELIKSVHGVGKQTALFVLVFTNGFTLFDDWRKFACYCGIAPFEYSSGTSIRGKTRVSHLANKKLKSLLTMCALNTIKKENEFKIYYDRRRAEGKSHMSTLNIIRNKIVSRIFAAIRRGTPYQSSLQQAA